MTTTTTNAPVQTAADLLAQAGNIGAELVQQAPTAETTTTLTDKAAVAVDAVKTAAGASLSFLQEHKTAVVAVAGVTAAAGAGYAAYKWFAKRRDEKRAKAKEAFKAAAEESIKEAANIFAAKAAAKEAAEAAAKAAAEAAAENK